MRFYSFAQRRSGGRHYSGPAKSGSQPVALRIAAGVLGLAMLASIGAGAAVSDPAQANTPGATASATPAVKITPETAEAEKPAPVGVPTEVPVETPAATDAATTATASETQTPDVAPTLDSSSKTAVTDLAAPQFRMQALAARLVNPQLPTTCGLSISVVLDLSNSLSDNSVLESKKAAKAVVDSLRGTPSSVGIYTFATFAPDGTNTAIAKTSVSTSDAATSINTKIDQIKRVPSNVGGTNWDAALRQIPQGQYDIVLFVTDGNPTAYGTPRTGTSNADFGSRVDAIDLSTAVTAADALKASGTFVMGLAVGSDINLPNIQAISGARSGTDYFQISDYAQLTAKLAEIALKNCQGTVSIVKQVRDLGGNLVPAAGWTFSSRASDQVSPTSSVTGADGAVNFKVNDLTADGRTVQFAEVQQNGFALETQNGLNAKCVNNVTGLSVPVTNAGGLGFAVAVKRSDAVSCEVINKMVPTQITVTKTWVNAIDGDTASFAANTQNGASTAPTNGNVITTSFAYGTTVNVSEVLAEGNKGMYTTALKCTNAAGTTVAEGTLTGSLTLGGSNVTCAYTNTNTAAAVVVEKKWIVDGTAYDNGKQPAGISAELTLTGPGAAGATAQAWGAERAGYFVGSNVTIAETMSVDPQMRCTLTKSALTLANGTTVSNTLPSNVVLAAGTNSYLVTNTVDCITELTLLKFIDDRNGGNLAPGDFTLTAAPAGGTVWEVSGATAVTPSNTKTVVAGTAVALSESSTLKPAYLQLSLQRYTGTLNADLSLADPDAWVDADSATVSVTRGHHEVYRFVNASVPTMTLPLTGGTGSTAYLMVGGGLLVLAVLATTWILVRRGKANRA